MSEIGETMQIVEMAGRGAFIIGRASLAALQFILQLCHSKRQKAIQLAYGELSLKKLQEKQALNGDQAVFFQVHTQASVKLEEIKEELSKRGIAFSQLADFNDKDGFTQFYTLASDTPKLNAYFKKHAELKAETITVDDYYKTTDKEQRKEVKADAVHAVSPELEKEVRGLTQQIQEHPVTLDKQEHLAMEELEKKYDCLLYKVPEKEGQYFMFQASDLERSEGKQRLHLDLDRDYLIINGKGQEVELVNGAEVYFRYYPLERNLFKELETKVISADRLKMDKTYKDFLDMPYSRELYISKSLLVAELDRTYEFKVPGTDDKYTIEIPKEQVRTLDKGKNFLAVIHLDREVQAKALDIPIQMKGHEVEEFFVTSRNLAEKAGIKGPSKDVPSR